jgi:hypothetical protein
VEWLKVKALSSNPSTAKQTTIRELVPENSHQRHKEEGHQVPEHSVRHAEVEEKRPDTQQFSPLSVNGDRRLGRAVVQSFRCGRQTTRSHYKYVIISTKHGHDSWFHGFGRRRVGGFRELQSGRTWHDG